MLQDSHSESLMNKSMDSASVDIYICKLMPHLFYYLYYGLSVFPKSIFKHEKKQLKKLTQSVHSNKQISFE